MQTKLIFALIAAAAFTSAQAEQSYVGVNVGRAEQKLTASGIGSVKDTDTGFKLYGGYQFDQNFGIEAGYNWLGTANFGSGVNSFTTKPQSLYLAATATLPLADQFALFAKLGASRNRTRLSAPGVSSDTVHRTSALVGVGLSYAFAPNIAAVLEYEDFGKLADEDGVNLKANLISVGLRFKF